jgi:molybdenum cofactor guanylyltransferase
MSEGFFAAVLAGGEARRFGADKAMADLAGRPMIVRTGERLRNEADALAVVAHAAGAAALGCALLNDPVLPVRGPLLGVLAALEWAHAHGAAWVVTAPCDVPLIPVDLGFRLVDAARHKSASVACAEAEGVHPLCAAWATGLAGPLRGRLAAGVHPPVRDFAPDMVHVTFADAEAFINVNTRADLVRIAPRFAPP